MEKEAKHRAHPPLLLRLIALTKLLKATLLVVVGAGLLRLARADVHDALALWVSQMRVDPHSHMIHSALEKILGISAHTLHLYSVGTFIYAVLYATEGVGLLFDKLWAEWMTVITTAGFVPLEIYELANRFTPVRLTVLVLNVLILAYLIRRVRWRYTARQTAAETRDSGSAGNPVQQSGSS